MHLQIYRLTKTVRNEMFQETGRLYKKNSTEILLTAFLSSLVTESQGNGSSMLHSR